MSYVLKIEVNAIGKEEPEIGDEPVAWSFPGGEQFRMVLSNSEFNHGFQAQRQFPFGEDSDNAACCATQAKRVSRSGRLRTDAEHSGNRIRFICDRQQLALDGGRNSVLTGIRAVVRI